MVRPGKRTQLRCGLHPGLCMGTLTARGRHAFQAVNEKVLPAEPTRTVRSAMPGKVRSDLWCDPLKTRCSYTCAHALQALSHPYLTASQQCRHGLHAYNKPTHGITH